MSDGRLTQNFANLHATIVTASDVGSLIAILGRLGIRCTQLPGAGGTVPALVPLLRRDQDILIIDCDTEAAAELSGGASPAIAAFPIIGLLTGESPSRLRTMMRLGATALIRYPVHGATIYPALYIGINAHRRRHQAEAEIQQLERRRRGRRHIFKAILQRMYEGGLTDDEAYEALRREATQARQSIEDYCESSVLSPQSYVFGGSLQTLQDQSNRSAAPNPQDSRQ